MSKPGFYNDNEYRAYPFLDEIDVPKPGPNENPLPQDAIVDAGFVFSLSANYNDETNYVFLRRVTAVNGVMRFHFATTAFCNVLDAFLNETACSAYDLVFTRNYEYDERDEPQVLENEWAVEYADSDAVAGCVNEPLWSGFLVTGKLDSLLAQVLAANGAITFGTPYLNPTDEGLYETIFFHRIEPARIQNLRKGYLRSISVGNYERTVVPTCSDEIAPAPENPCADFVPPNVVPNATCLQGPIKFKEGYTTRITQTGRVNTLIFTAEKGSGAPSDDDLCNNSGEVPFYPEETALKPLIHNGSELVPQKRSKFLSGGWACNDLIFTLNGIGGSNVNIVGGKNIGIGYDDVNNKITVTLSKNAQGRCQSPPTALPTIATKIKTTPTTKGYSPTLKQDGTKVEIDDTLYFLETELGPPDELRVYEITCRAFFTGAPPIAQINEPAGNTNQGILYLSPTTYKIVTQAGKQVVESAVYNVQSVNDFIADIVEPKTYYENDNAAVGYLVEIHCRVVTFGDEICCQRILGTTHNVGLHAGRAGIFLRWGSTVEGQNTTLQNGIITAQRVSVGSLPIIID